MDKITEIQIERYIRFPNTLTAEEFRIIKLYLAENEEARSIAIWFQQFYSEFDQLSRPSIVTLDYYKPKAQNGGPLVLAADSGPDNSMELVTRATFLAEQEGTLVRILEDKRNQKYQIHVLSKFLNEDERVLINIDQQSLEIVTDRGGKIKNIEEPVMSDINWKSASVVLRLPSSTCSFDPQNTSLPFTVCDECTLNWIGNDVYFSTTEASITRVLIDQEGHTELIYLEQQEITFKADPTKPFMLYLYT